MEKKPFLTESMAQDIIQDVPTPFHVYDEKGIRENARRINKAFSWNKGFREYFAVKALPNPVILQILKEEGCGVDCSSLTELMLSEVCGFSGSDIMFSSNQTPVEDMKKAYELGAYINLDDATMVDFLDRWPVCRRTSSAVTIRAAPSSWARAKRASRSWTSPATPSTA